MMGLDGIFGAMGNVASTILQGQYNSRIAGENYAYSRDLAALQNQYNIDMWNMNNEYNSPKNQLQRLIAAGLNPNLAYGTVSTGNSQRPPEQVTGQYHRDSVDMRGMFDGIGSIFSDIMNFARFQEDLNGKRIANARSALALLDAEALLSAKYLYKDKNPWYVGNRQIFLGSDYAKHFGDPGYYTLPLSLTDYYRDKLNADLGFRKNQSSLIAGKLTYQNLINSWFKTDRIFNMVNGAAKTILGAIPFGRFIGGGNPSRYFEGNRNWKPRYNSDIYKTWQELGEWTPKERFVVRY